MAALAECRIDISRRPEDVFSYATDLSRYDEWQPAVVSAHQKSASASPPAVGSTAAVTRRVGPRKVATIEEITGLHPPRTWTVRGVGGPFVAIARGTIQPLDGGNRSRVTLAVEFEADGIGGLLVGFVRWQARKQLRRNAQALKERLEGQSQP